MANAPPAALLRLREADVVRLCGFAAAARGLELADRRAVSAGERDGARLRATVADDAARSVAVELPGEGEAGAMRWTCSGHGGTAAAELGCAHVAALLTAWIRAPGDFPATDAPPVSAAPPPHQRPPVSQPPLVQTGRSAGPGGASVQDELAALPPGELLAIAGRVVGGERSEHEARAALAEALADPARLAALLARLEAGPQQLFAWLRLLGGAITASDLDALGQRAGRPASVIRADLAVLARHGLIFPAPRSWGELSGWRIPPEPRAALPPRLPLDPQPTREPRGAPSPRAGAETPGAHSPAVRVERAALRPLLLAFALLARAPAPLGPFTGDGIGAEVETPHSRADARLSAGRLAALARAAGLDPVAAALARRALSLADASAPGQPLADLARVPAAERLAALRAGFGLWRDDNADAAAEAELGDDVGGPATGARVRLRVETAHSAFRPGELGAELARARRFALRLLAAAAPGAWYALDEFVELVWRLDPLFLRRRQQAYERPIWRLEAPGSDGVWRLLRPSVRDEWMAGEGVYLRRLLAGALRAWGTLDLAYDTRNRPFAFRLSAFGRLALEDRADGGEGPDVTLAATADELLGGDWGPAVLPTRDGSLAAQPLSAGPALLDALERWARVTGLAGARLIYTLSPDLACAAFDRGASPDELSVQLCAGGEGNARAAALTQRRLAAWHAEYGQTRLRGGWALLEARDEPALVEALALVPGLAARCHRLDVSAALIRPDDLAALRPLLARRGYPV